MYPKLHHGGGLNWTAVESLAAGWGNDWKAAGFTVIGWGWLEGDPVQEAELAVWLCRTYGLAGYIANAEAPYEGPENYWKSAAFVQRFRELAPHAPLALSYIGDGFPYRDLPFQPWIDAGAAFMPQCYWGDSATSIQPSLDAASRVPINRSLLVPTLGTSGFINPYDPGTYAAELLAAGTRGFNVWLLESTPDDTLRALSPAT